mmetsp:Transcript_23023/g.30057  ORF Transcript_23023/g.30057 Transcript_23023/m.30057 type:complete len:573 (-) Transcript_23023:328-2046(-)
MTKTKNKKTRISKSPFKQEHNETEDSIVSNLQKSLMLECFDEISPKFQDSYITGFQQMEVCNCKQNECRWDEQWETKCNFADAQTVLMNTVISGNYEKVCELLKDDEMVEKINTNIAGFTPLMMAARKGHTDIVTQLISSGALINFQTEKGTALTEASQNGHTHVVSNLLHNGAHLEPMALTMASLEGYLETVTFLISAGADVDSFTYPGTALFTAAFNGHFQVAQCLLEAGAQVKNAILRRRYYGFRAGTSVLVAAGSRGHTGLVKLLLEQVEVDYIDQNGWTQLIHASANGLDELANNLLQKGASVEASSAISCQVYGTPFFKGTTSLIAAARNGHTSIVEILLGRNASVDACDQKGNTALTEASKNGHQGIVAMLLAAYIEPCLQNKIGVSALLLASSRNKKKKSKKRASASLKPRRVSPKKARIHVQTLSPSTSKREYSDISNVEAFLKEWVQKTCGSIIGKYQELVEYFISAKLSTDCIEHITSSLVVPHSDDESPTNQEDSNEVFVAETDELKPTPILCCVCLENPKSVVILPCKHLCLCDMCASADLESCPMCRILIEDKLSVFT